jgi:sucrose-6-phosphate hydrolase SacC (GH32 family)
VQVVYDVAKQELTVNGHRASAPLQSGLLNLRILTDRTAFETFAAGGLTYIPMPVTPKADERGVTLGVQGGSVVVHSLEIHELASIWTSHKKPD